MKKPWIPALTLSLALLASGLCGQEAIAAGTSETIDTTQLFSDRDFRTDYEEAESARIELKGDTATSSSDAASISGSTVTVTEEGTYIFSGTLDNGMILVNVSKEEKVQLVFDDVTIHNETSAAVYVQQADKVFLTMADGSQNVLSNGGAFEAIDENNIDAVIFSKDDLTLNGSGTMEITSPAGNGIVSKDSLTITGGSYIIDCESHGLEGKDDISIADGEFQIVCGQDGLHGDNEDDEEKGFVYVQSGTFDIEAADDGIHSSSWVHIDGGNFEISAVDDAVHGESSLTVTDGTIHIPECYEGLEALVVNISGGDITIVADDDGLNAAGGTDGSGTENPEDGDFGGQNSFGGRGMGHGGGRGGFGTLQTNGSIVISGGTIHVTAYGDGIDANGSVTITGGNITVCGPTQGDTSALDFETTAEISGGTFIGTGADAMAQTFDSSEQGVVAVRVGQQSEGTQIQLADSEGTVILTHTPELPFSVVILSSPEIETGETYTLTVGDTSDAFVAA